MRVFVNGVGTFDEGLVGGGLRLLYKAGSRISGIVAPTASITLEQFQADLAATRLNWFIDES